MSYYEPKSGEWIQPQRRRYKFACCDCGLVHVLNFRLISNNRGSGKKIQFKAERDNRATGQIRRWIRSKSA